MNNEQDQLTLITHTLGADRRGVLKIGSKYHEKIRKNQGYVFVALDYEVKIILSKSSQYKEQFSCPRSSKGAVADMCLPNSPQPNTDQMFST